jgi:YfiH family protein
MTPADLATTLPAPFRWAGEHIGIDLGGMATALFTTRRGGVSAAPYDTLNLGLLTDDDPEAVAENRERLLVRTGTRRLLQGRQVHGAVVERVRSERSTGELLDADGQATALQNVAAVVLTADCLAVALASQGAVAMVHAGWRGLADGVVEEGLRALRELDPSGDRLVAAIGPAACGRCYEVGDEVREAFGVAPTGGPAPIDLKAIARARLEAAGAEVHDVGLCTIHDDPSLFFSHRRDRGLTGRQAGAVWR